MGLMPLPSTLGPFDWGVMPILRVGPDGGHYDAWGVASLLLKEQEARLAADGIVTPWPPGDRRDHEGSLWTPAVDLDLGGATTSALFEVRAFVPFRPVWSVADARSEARLMRGTVLRLETVGEDRSWERLGSNAWSIEPSDLGVGFIHSALENRWGGPPLLADALIVPLDHPIVGDSASADRLVTDLQDITRAFRIRIGQPADGACAGPGTAQEGRLLPIDVVVPDGVTRTMELT